MNCKNFYDDIQKYPADDSSSKSPWRLLQPHPIHPHKRKKCRLKLTNLTRNDAGLYRCISNERVLKSFELDVQGELFGIVQSKRSITLVCVCVYQVLSDMYLMQKKCVSDDLFIKIVFIHHTLR